MPGYLRSEKEPCGRRVFTERFMWWKLDSTPGEVALGEVCGYEGSAFIGDWTHEVMET